jgi:hypothetical protein
MSCQPLTYTEVVVYNAVLTNVTWQRREYPGYARPIADATRRFEGFVTDADSPT